jgi:Flp pilus assembly pilin Flp
MNGHFAAKLRRFARNSEGATMIEFAFIFPIVLMLTFGIMEVSLLMASLVTLEGGLKEASRYGITSQTPTAAQMADIQAQIPPKFAGADDRIKMIVAILNTHTLDLINLNDADVSWKIYDSFSVIKNGEPYNDLDGNGAYSPNYDNGLGPNGLPLPKGEPFSDMDCDHVRDGPGETSLGVGAAGNIVVYRVTYFWKILTPFVGEFLGEPDPDNLGGYRVPMNASIVVKNEPSLSGTSFCK